MVGVAGWYKVPFIGLNWPTFCTPGTDILTCTFTVGEDSGAVLFVHMKDRRFSNVVNMIPPFFSACLNCKHVCVLTKMSTKMPNVLNQVCLVLFRTVLCIC